MSPLVVLLTCCLSKKATQTTVNFGILVPVRTSFGLRQRSGTMYQRKVDVDMLNAVKSVLADVLSVSPSSELVHSKFCLASLDCVPCSL